MYVRSGEADGSSSTTPTVTRTEYYRLLTKKKKRVPNASGKQLCVIGPKIRTTPTTR